MPHFTGTHTSVVGAAIGSLTKVSTSVGNELLTRAQNKRVRLGGSGSLDEAFPPKPKGMHWRTYNRLAAEDEEADNLWGAVMMGKFGLGV